MVKPQELEEDIITMVNNDGLDSNMNFGHESFEDVVRVPLFEGSTLFSLSIIIFILNCFWIHGVFNTLITKLLTLLKKKSYLNRMRCQCQNMKL